VEKRYLQSVDGFIFNSESTRKDVEKSIEDSIDGVVAYPAGNRFQQAISHEMIRVRAQQDIPLQILFLGNVIPRKSLHILLAALRNIADKEWFLSVVGSLDHDAKYAHGIMQVVKSSGISKKVIFYGSLVEEDLEKILRKSHVMAVPSYHEGFGIVYLEGMAFGLPAIATTSGGAAEIITHEENGFLIPRDDVELLSEYLSILIENREILSRMGMAALDHFHQHPSWVESMSSIRDFLDHMIQKRVSQ
jgi:glycosyltransferase involved in cell wall biosynthesis